ncbi:hypothetical protein BaRGS_00001013, partial [Batillaria attramentaria]
MRDCVLLQVFRCIVSFPQCSSRVSSGERLGSQECLACTGSVLLTVGRIWARPCRVRRCPYLKQGPEGDGDGGDGGGGGCKVWR